MSSNLKKIASERIEILFRLAHEIIHEKPDFAKKYVELASKISMRTRLHLPPEYSIQICRHCKRFILPGTNSRVRIQTQREPHVVITCLYCGGKTRIPLKGKKQK